MKRPSVDLQTNISCLLEQRGTYEQKPRLTERSKKSSRPYNYWVRSNNIAQALSKVRKETIPVIIFEGILFKMSFF